MPLIYLPLIMYASWMEFMLRPLRIQGGVACAERDADAAPAFGSR